MKDRNYQERSKVKGQSGMFKQGIALLTLLTFLCQPMLAAAAGPVADPNAGAQKPIIDAAANGVPLVQITNPSAGGVSHNKYLQYNVDPQGVILNNSLKVTLTQQGGYVAGNPFLTSGTAKIILNEVTGNGASLLRGFTEVAGQRADVVIANPNGITCNGCGFINANRGVLTTGTPVFGGSGSLDAFRVTGGNINIEGAGLNAQGADALDLISRSVSINANAGVWANTLNIITGSNLVNYADLSTQAITPDGSAAPVFSLDVAALGGMYANKIRLVGTEAGIGVRNSGAIVSNGDFTLTSAGQIVNNGLIFADTLTMTAPSLVNDSINAVIATRSDTGAANFFIQDNFTNSNDAWIYSMGDIVIAGGVDATGNYTNAGSLLNQSATIEAGRDVTLLADTITNRKSVFATAEIVDPDRTTSFSGAIDIPAGYPRGVKYVTAGYISAYASYTRTTTVTTVIAGMDSSPGQILGGRDMAITANNLTNEYSTIAAGRDLTFNVSGELNNIGRGGFEVSANDGTLYLTYTRETRRCRLGFCWTNWTEEGHTAAYDPNPEIEHLSFSEGAANISAGNQLNINAGATIRNETRGPGTGSTISYARTEDRKIISGTETPPTLGASAPAGMFQSNPNPNGPLVETDPRFTNLRLFMSSDYMLSRLGYDPLLTQKRLGDGFYEQKLVLDEITKATGRRYLSNYASAEEQYLALMDAGVTYAKEFKLTIGVGLTAAQMAQLTSDMVWLVEKEVKGQKVLAPVVYLGQLHANDLAGSGALMAGRDISLRASNDLTNSGIIKAGYRNQIFASNITNIGGVIDAGGNTELTATKDIVNKSGTISGGTVALSAGRDIRNETATEIANYKNGQGTFTRVGKQATIESRGDLSATAGQDIVIAGSSVKSVGDTDLNAGRNLTITSVEKNDRIAVSFKDADGRDTGSFASEKTTNIVSSIDAGKNLSLNAKNNIALTGAQVAAGSDLNLTAGGDVSIREVRDRASYDSKLILDRGDYVRMKTVDEKAIGSNLSAGNNVTIQATGTSAAESFIEAQIQGGKYDPSSPNHQPKMQRELMIAIDDGDRLGYIPPKMLREDMVVIDDGDRIGYIPPPVLVKREQPVRGSILIQGSSITSKAGTINLDAKKDITIQEAREYHESLTESKNTRNRGILDGSTRTTTYDRVTKDLAVGSTLSGNNVVIQSGNNLTLQGNSTAASGDVTLLSGGNVAITEARDYQHEEHWKQEKVKGGMRKAIKTGLLMAMGVPMGSGDIGNSAPQNTDTLQSSTINDETVKASEIQAKGNVTILAGKFNQAKGQSVSDTSTPSDRGNILVRGSNILSENGAITLAAEKNISIQEAREAHDKNAEEWVRTKRFDSDKKEETRETGKQNLAVGSNLSGDTITAVSGKDLTIQGSNVMASNQLTLAAAENVNIVAAQETDHQEFEAKMKRFGVSLNYNKGKGTYGYSVGTDTLRDNQTMDSVNNVSSMVGSAFGNVDVSAGKDLTILGSQVIGKGNVSLAAVENVSILSAENTSSMSQENYSNFTGYTYTAQASGMSWAHSWGSDRSAATRTGNSVTNVASTVGSESGSVSILGGKDARIKGSTVFSDKATDIQGQNVSVEAAYDSMDGHMSAQNKKEQLTSSFRLAFTAGGKNTMETWKKSNTAQSDGAKYMYRYQAIQSMMSGPVGVGASVNIAYNSNKRQTSTDYHQAYAVGSNLLSNNELNIRAIGDREKQDGDITFIGSSAQAKNITLDAARDISLLSAQNASDNNTTFGAHDSTIAISASVQVSSSVNSLDKSKKSDNSGSSVGWSVSISGQTNSATSEQSQNDLAHVATQLAAAENLTIKSGRDTNMRGAQASAETIKADIGRNLNLESLQDSSIYRGRDENQGGSFSISYGQGASSGSSGSSKSGWGVSGSYTFVQGKMDSEYRSVNQQTGLFAGKGGYDIYVGKNTDLKGSVIASNAEASKNKLSTETLTYSDLHNNAEYEASKYGGTVSLSYSKGSETSNSTGETKPTGGTSVGFSPIIGMPSGDDAKSTTRSAVSDGTIEVRGNKDQNLASLSRDTNTAHQKLDKIFDQKEIAKQQELSQVFGETANQAVGDLTSKLKEYYQTRSDEAKQQKAAAQRDMDQAALSGDTKLWEDAQARSNAAQANIDSNQSMYDLWKDGGIGKIALHTIVGGVQAQLGGGNIAAGALGGLTSEAAVPYMAKALEAMKIKQGSELYNSLMKVGSAVIGAGVGAAVGGDANGAGSGAATALSNIENNYLKHQEVLDMKAAIKKCGNDQACRQKVEKDYQAISDQHDNELRSCVTDDCIKWHLSEIDKANESGAFKTLDSTSKGIVAKWQDKVRYEGSDINGAEALGISAQIPKHTNFTKELDAHCLQGDGAFCSNAIKDSLKNCTGADCDAISNWVFERMATAGCGPSSTSDVCQGLSQIRGVAQTKAQALENTISPIDLVPVEVLATAVGGIAIKGATAMIGGVSKLAGKDAAVAVETGLVNAVEKDVANLVNVPSGFKAAYQQAPAAKAEIDTLAKNIADEVGGVVATTEIKSEARAVEKIRSDYNGDVTRITDLARNTIVVSEEKIGETIARLEAQGASIKIIEGEANALGYSGANATVKTKSGLTAEIQVNTPQMIYAKESEAVARQILGDETYNAIAAKTGVPGGQGHALYEQWRTLDPESSAAKELAEQSKAYYNSIRNSVPTPNNPVARTEALNFTTTTIKRMEDSNRFVPIQTLQDAITNTKALPDPQGSSAQMHYTTMFKNGQTYNLEVLYNAENNTILHFMYTRDAAGPLPAIK